MKKLTKYALGFLVAILFAASILGCGESSEIKKVADGYVELADKYLKFAKTYNPDDTSSAAKYAELTGEAAEWAKKAQEIDKDSLSDADKEYLAKAVADATKKITEAGKLITDASKK